jgi:hypothetical protein
MKLVVVFIAIFKRLKPGCFFENRAERDSQKNNCSLPKRESLFVRIFCCVGEARATKNSLTFQDKGVWASTPSGGSIPAPRPNELFDCYSKHFTAILAEI